MAKRNVRARTIDGKKLCHRCSKWQDPLEFNPRKNEADGLHIYCKTCINRERLPKYGLTVERYDQMVKDQNGTCAICLKPPSRAFDIDHDHACCPSVTSCGECVRGLLCFNCNSSLGKMKDDVESLKRAVAYLESNNI